MGYARYVGRVGALAVAMGVGTAIGSPAGLAWAETDGSGDTQATSESSPGNSDSTASKDISAASKDGAANTPDAAPDAQAPANVPGRAATGDPSSAPDLDAVTPNSTTGVITVGVGGSPPVVIGAQTNSSAENEQPDPGTQDDEPAAEEIDATENVDTSAEGGLDGGASADAAAESAVANSRPGTGVRAAVHNGGLSAPSVARTSAPPAAVAAPHLDSVAAASARLDRVGVLRAAAAADPQPQPQPQPAPGQPFEVEISRPDAGVVTPILAPVHGLVVTLFELLGYSPTTGGNPVLAAMWGLYRRIESTLVNNAPEAGVSTVAFGVDPATGQRVVHGQLSFTDPDGDPLTYAIVDGDGAIDQKGNFNLLLPAVVPPGQPITFTVAVSDGTSSLLGAASTTTAKYSLVAIDEGLVLTGFSQPGPADPLDPNASVKGSFTVRVSDPSRLQVSLAVPPIVGGKVDFSPPAQGANREFMITYTYTPDLQARIDAANGGPQEDRFVISVTDGVTTLALPEAHAQILPMMSDQGPRIISHSGPGAPDSAGRVSGTLTVQDPDGGPIQVLLGTLPIVGGKVDISGLVPSPVDPRAFDVGYVYTPDLQAQYNAFTGAGPKEDFFSIIVTDGRLSVPVDVRPTIAPVPPPTDQGPQITDHTGPSAPDSQAQVTGTFTVSGAAGRIIDVTIAQQPRLGDLTLSQTTGTGQFTVTYLYVPSPQAQHDAARGGPTSDLFIIKVTDGQFSAGLEVRPAIAPSGGTAGAASQASAAADPQPQPPGQDVQEEVSQPGSGLLAPLFAPMRWVVQAVFGALGFDPAGDSFLRTLWDGYRGIESLFANEAPFPGTTALAVITAPDGQQRLEGQLTFTDADFDRLTYSLVEGNGTIDQKGNISLLLPATPAGQPFTFTVAVSDGTSSLLGAASTTTVKYTVNLTNIGAPVLVGMTGPGAPDPTDPDAKIAGSFTVRNADPSRMRVGLAAPPVVGGKVEFGPPVQAANGDVTITYVYTPDLAARINAGNGGPAQDTFVITVNVGTAMLVLPEIHPTILPISAPSEPLTFPAGFTAGGAAGFDPRTGVLYQTLFGPTGTQRIMVVRPDGTGVASPDLPGLLVGAPLVDPLSGVAYQTSTDFASTTGPGTTWVNIIGRDGSLISKELAGRTTGGAALDPNSGFVYQTTFTPASDTVPAKVTVTVVRPDGSIANSHELDGQPSGSVLLDPRTPFAYLTTIDPGGNLRVSIIRRSDGSIATTSEHIDGVQSAPLAVDPSSGLAYLTTSEGPIGTSANQTWVTVIGPDGSIVRVADPIPGQSAGRVIAPEAGVLFQITREANPTGTGSKISVSVISLEDTRLVAPAKQLLGEFAGPAGMVPTADFAYVVTHDSSGKTWVSVVTAAGEVLVRDALPGPVSGGFAIHPATGSAYQVITTPEGPRVSVIGPDAGVATSEALPGTAASSQPGGAGLAVDPLSDRVFIATSIIEPSGVSGTWVSMIRPDGLATTLNSTPLRGVPVGPPVVDPRTGFVYQTTMDSEAGARVAFVTVFRPDGSMDTTQPIPGSPTRGVFISPPPNGRVYQVTSTGVAFVNLPQTPSQAISV